MNLYFVIIKQDASAPEFHETREKLKYYKMNISMSS